MALRTHRLGGNTSELFDHYTASIDYDCRLARYDIFGSLAHVNMLAHTGIIEKDAAQKIQAGLVQVLADYEEGKLELLEGDEDIHMNIERWLTEAIGDAAGKMHTGRSRSDQVALDVKLFMREQVLKTADLLLNLAETITKVSENNLDIIMPGYTHLQRAQPVLLAHHLMAYGQMFYRDADRLLASFERLNTCPLGAGALAGSSLPLDREYIAKLLKFDAPTANSLDTVGDRDHLLEYLSNAAICFSHLSRLNEDLILWASGEFDFIELPDEFCTTSSMMPHKKNPDLAELIRGKSGRAYGNLMTLLTVMKSLSLSYFRDLQEDKEPLFDTIDALDPALELMAEMLAKTTFNTERMHEDLLEGFTNATDATDYLVEKGLPFRKAHVIIGTIVRHCAQNNLKIEDLPLEELKKHSDLFEQDFYARIDHKKILELRELTGGPGPKAVKTQIDRLKESLKTLEAKSAGLLGKTSFSAEELLIDSN